MKKKPEVAADRKRAEDETDAKRSRSNSIQHGLTASTLLPDVLQHDQVDTITERLREEWLPETPTEEYLIREAARHQAVLGKIELMENSVLRRGARAALLLNESEHTSELFDIALAGAGTSDAVQRISRYRRTHERAVLRSLDALRALRESRRASESRAPSKVSALSEAACERWLAERLVARFVCPKCSGRAAIYLVKAKAVQCRGCRAQIGLRSGTVMAGSRLPLATWFNAIRALSKDRETSTDSLAGLVRISRIATVRLIRKRILSELCSKESSELLAGLDCDRAWAGLLSRVS